MSVLNNIKIELIIFLLIAICIFIFPNIDINIHNSFSKNEYINDVNLKLFFENITEIGNSIWFFGISIIFIIFIFLDKQIKFINLDRWNIKFNFFVSLITYLLIAGFFTQLFKHIFGRSRPNHTNFEEGIIFNFFNADASFHSFPSGHSSTIFMVCFILCAVMPKLKYFLYFFSILIALSRVIVGAHFFTDIIGGALLSLIVFKILNSLYFFKYNIHNFKEIIFTEYVSYKNILLCLIIFGLFLTVGSSLDVVVSQLFYLGNSQFYLQSFDYITLFFRDILLPGILIYLLIVPLLGKYLNVKNLYFGHSFKTKEILLLWSSQFIIVLIFINLILKNLWGRSRPGEILEFGGEYVFTPWYRYSDICASNCSFVSGDSSVGFSIVVLYFITKNSFFLYASLTLGFSLGIIRIMEGGHFLSDILFSGIIVMILNFFIFRYFKNNYE